MASSGDIETVRRNTDEQNSDTYSDDEVGALVDGFGVAGATATIWEQKAAQVSTLVNVTEAGASHAMSDIYKNAAAQAAYWSKKVADEAAATTGRVRIRQIVRD